MGRVAVLLVAVLCSAGTLAASAVVPAPNARGYGMPYYFSGTNCYANGAGLPPYNSTAKPSMHFIMLDACDCGWNNNFIRCFFPNLDAYSGWVVDQAYLGWKGAGGRKRYSPGSKLAGLCGMQGDS